MKVTDPTIQSTIPQPYDTPATLNQVENRRKAEEETSVYYITTLQTLAASQQVSANEPSLNQVKNEEAQKSLLGRAKEWLWSLFGFGKKEPAAIPEEEEQEENVLHKDPFPEYTPRLDRPDSASEKRLSKAIVELNKELVTRLKDISEFEEEMRKSNSNNMDKLIFLQLVESSQRQRQLKEDSSIFSHEEIVTLHKKNKVLQDKYYALLDEINSRAKTNNILHWVNVGATVAIVSSIAATFFTAGAGAILAAGTPFMSFAKGATTLAEGVLKYKNDLKTGELQIVTKDSKRNSNKINDELSDLQVTDEEIGNLLKVIRHHLENQSRAERGSFGRAAG